MPEEGTVNRVAAQLGKATGQRRTGARLGSGRPVDRNRVAAEAVGRECPAKIGQCGLDGRVAVDLPVQCHANPARVSPDDRIEQAPASFPTVSGRPPLHS